MNDDERHDLDPSGALSERELEALFEAARQTAPVAGPELLARVLADGEALLPAAPGPAARRGGGLADLPRALLAAIGGWTALAGLATATLAGIWIGYVRPDLTPDWAMLTGGTPERVYDLSEFEPRLDDFTPLTEGS